MVFEHLTLDIDKQSEERVWQMTQRMICNHHTLRKKSYFILVKYKKYKTLLILRLIISFQEFEFKSINVILSHFMNSNRMLYI